MCYFTCYCGIHPPQALGHAVHLLHEMNKLDEADQHMLHVIYDEVYEAKVHISLLKTAQ